VTSSSGLLAQDGVSLLAQSDPNPEPCHCLNKDEGKKETVLEHITAPSSRAIRRVVRARVRKRRTGGLVVYGRRWSEQEDVGNETEGEE
jgi:hypothetical protein